MYTVHEQPICSGQVDGGSTFLPRPLNLPGAHSVDNDTETGRSWFGARDTPPSPEPGGTSPTSAYHVIVEDLEVGSVLGEPLAPQPGSLHFRRFLQFCLTLQQRPRIRAYAILEVLILWGNVGEGFGTPRWSLNLTGTPLPKISHFWLMAGFAGRSPRPGPKPGHRHFTPTGHVDGEEQLVSKALGERTTWLAGSRAIWVAGTMTT